MSGMNRRSARSERLTPRGRTVRLAARAVAAWVAVAALTTGAGAEQDPNLARGFSPGELYDFSGLDSVNLFNGVLGLNLPIGSRYPVGDGLSYGLTLSYSSSLWDPETRTVSGPPPATLTRMLARRSSNAGLGWSISLGGDLYGPVHPSGPPPLSGGYQWEGPDGSVHVFYNGLHWQESSACIHTRDNSYLRLCGSGNLRTLEFPDGVKQTFERVPSAHRISNWDLDRFRLTRIEDRLGNSVTVTYIKTAGKLTWKIEDSVGRSQTVEFVQQTVDGGQWWRVTEAKLLGVGGIESKVLFEYTTEPIARSCKNTDLSLPTPVAVPLLRTVILPAGAGSYRMPLYNSACQSTQPLRDLPGTLARLELPTGGRLEWTYRDYLFLLPNPNDPVQKILEKTTGIATKKTLNASGGCDYGPGLECTWTYTSFSQGDNRSTRVESPVGDTTVHHFRQLRPRRELPGFQGWDYGLAFSTAQSNSGLWISHEIYDGPPTGTPVRSVYVAYERDRVDPNILSALSQDWANSNRRVIAQRTLYHDDMTGGQPRFSATAMSDFDGLGHHRNRVVSGNLGGSGDHTEVTQYNPQRGTYEVDPVTNLTTGKHSYTKFPDGSAWVLGTYEFTRAEETGSAVHTRTCFEASTGRLLRRRLQASASAPGSLDVIVEHTRTRVSPNEIRYQERVYGGDVQSVSTASELCTLTLPATPVYRTQYTDLHGTRARTERLNPSTSALIVKTLDLAVEVSTGLPLSSTDPAALTTDFAYDAFNRLTWLKPRAGGDAWTEIVYRTATPSLPARVTVNRRPNGSPGGAVLEASRTEFDPFGRPNRDERQMPGSVWTAAVTRYNAMGWVTEVTERGVDGGGLPHSTRYLNHDPFGRPTLIKPPDFPASAGHDITIDYDGIRSVERGVSVQTGATGGETRYFTEERYDHLGRLFQVREPSGAGGAILPTDYKYDAAGRLTRVDLTDGGFTQSRTFAYDGRGFLTSETHPENGTTLYRQVDPLGHARRKTTGASSGPFDLGFTYDAADRLTLVREWGTSGSGRLLKEFTYGTGTSAANRSNGKVVTAVRHNHVLNPTTGNPLDVLVTETYTYGGSGGRVSSRATALSTGHGFTQGWSYSGLGEVTSVVYPTCTHAAACGTDPRPRTVGFTRTHGYLTAVPGYATSITYHPNGMLKEVQHANGVVYGQGLDPHWMRRPGSLSVQHPTSPLSLVEGAPAGTPLPYAYDGAGNVKTFYDWRYRYDGVSRVLEGVIAGGKSQAYGYDPFGNILTVTTNRTGVPQTVALGVDKTTNRLSASAYDTAGNLTSRGGFGYSYDALSMMWRMTGGGNHKTHIYTADDERIWAVDASTSPWTESFTLRDLDGKVLRVFSTANGFNALAWERDYVHRDGNLLATARVNGASENRYHFHLDHLGTPLLITNPQGGTEALHSYFPFGEEINPNADAERMKLTGHERDLNKAGQTDDLDYMHARYCSPLLGKMLSVDPRSQRAASRRPQSWNRFSYAHNNPLSLIDPDGREVAPPRDRRTRKAVEKLISTNAGREAYGSLQRASGLYEFTVSSSQLTPAERIRVRQGETITKRAAHFEPRYTTTGGKINWESGGKINLDYGIVRMANDEPYSGQHGDTALVAHEVKHAVDYEEDREDFLRLSYEQQEESADELRDAVIEELHRQTREQRRRLRRGDDPFEGSGYCSADNICH